MTKKREKKLSKKAWGSDFTQKMIRPVDIEIWRACWQVYFSAASFTMPVKNPSEQKFNIDGTTYSFSDIPINRGMLAVRDFMPDRPDLWPALFNRLISTVATLNELRSNPAFEKFIRSSEPSGALEVSMALLDAFASATFVERTLNFDKRSLLEIAEKETGGEQQ